MRPTDPYSVLEDHTKNLTMLCSSMKNLSKKNLSTEELFSEFSERIYHHVLAILETAKALPEEELFTEFCLHITPLGEGPDFFQNNCQRILEYYQIQLQDLWKR